MNLTDRVAVGLGTAARGGAIWIALAAAVAQRQRTLRPLIVTSSVAWSAEATALALARLIGRGRPCRRRPALIDCPRSPSFPSSHSACAAAAALALSQHEPQLTAPLLAAASAVAGSRVRVGVHHVSDVAAGFGLGIAVALSARHALG
jgi:undecaprenyl-diphosphatase